MHMQMSGKPGRAQDVAGGSYIATPTRPNSGICARAHVSTSLSCSADGLSERMQEARQGRRELEQASLTIMQMDAKIRLLSSAKGQTDEKVCVCVRVRVCVRARTLASTRLLAPFPSTPAAPLMLPAITRAGRHPDCP